MQQFERHISMDEAQLHNCMMALPHPAERICFFDIETTGLSPEVSSLYLIGVLWFSGGVPCLNQWFADDYVSEKEILASFSQFAAGFFTYIHYNGDTFDIPYLEKKFHSHGLPSPFASRETIDLYRLVQRKKDWFGTPDMKLSTMAHFLGFRRNDTCSGQECIRLYAEFMQKKFFRDNLADQRREQLLCHNHDDLLGTVICSQFLLYRDIPEHPTCSLEQDTLVIRGLVSGTYPHPLTVDKEQIRYHFHSCELRMEISLYRGTLYHFFKDYKNYYYLPEEDTAIHKSVGAYVDPAHRRPATAACCYTKKTGLFLPLPKKFIPDYLPLFRKERRGGISYLLLDVEKQPTLSEEFVRGLLSHLLTVL